MLRLYERLNPDYSRTNSKTVQLPRVIKILQKCVEHKIQDSLITSLHFYDLYTLILSLDISNIKQALKDKQAKRNTNAETRDISGKEALQFLKPN